LSARSTTRSITRLAARVRDSARPPHADGPRPRAAA
jgi:hypothetical protein